MNHLRLVMRLNATSCVSFGFLFVVMSHAVATFLGDAPHLIVIALGVGLIGNGVHLVAASRRTEICKAEVIWFSLGDFSWWLGTLGLIAASYWITNPLGILVAIIVALGVASLGVAQLWVLGLQSHGHNSKQHLQALATSWMAFPMWVKVWLVFLNGVFLAAFAFFPDRTATTTLFAYFATAPLLAGQIGYDGGLRRILALAHLVPWIPLLVWLLIAADGTGYTTLLTVTVAVCLVFDINDLRLFIKGDRAVLGALSKQGS